MHIVRYQLKLELMIKHSFAIIYLHVRLLSMSNIFVTLVESLTSNPICGIRFILRIVGTRTIIVPIKTVRLSKFVTKAERSIIL